MIAEAVHLLTTCVACGAEGRTSEGLIEQSATQTELESHTKMRREQARPRAAIGEACSQALAWGSKQASSRWISFDNSCCTESCVDKSARWFPNELLTTHGL